MRGKKKLNEEQQNVVSKITMEYDAGERKTYLIKGVPEAERRKSTWN